MFPALYLRGKERRASTASVATLAVLALRTLKQKLLVGIVPNPYKASSVPEPVFAQPHIACEHTELVVQVVIALSLIHI